MNTSLTIRERGQIRNRTIVHSRMVGVQMVIDKPTISSSKGRENT